MCPSGAVLIRASNVACLRMDQRHSNGQNTYVEHFFFPVQRDV